MNEEPKLNDGQAQSEEIPTLTFHMQKGNLFRVVYCDGVWVSSSPSGGVQFMFYHERPPIPQQVTYSMEGGLLGEEVPGTRIMKKGMVREIEVSVILPPHVLVNMQAWLNDYSERIASATQNET